MFTNNRVNPPRLRQSGQVVKRQSPIANLFSAPNFLDMSNPAFGILNGHPAAELENFDMFRLHKRLERGEVNHAGAGRTMVARGKLNVVDVKSRQPVGK